MAPTLLLIAALGVGQPAAPAADPQNVLLEFSASWCGPCQQMAPIVARLHREGLPIQQIDIDRQRDLANRYNVTGIPAFVVIVGGREVHRAVGGTTEASLRQMLAMVPPVNAPPVVAAPTRPAPSPTAQPQPSRPQPAAPASTNPGYMDDIPSRVAAAEPSPFDDADAVRTAMADEPAAAAPTNAKRGWLNMWGKRPAPAAPALAQSVAAKTAEVRAQSPEPAAPAVARDPMQSAVRIRVKDAVGVSFGTGTVIACQDDKALVLSCAHILKKLTTESTIEVDLFPQGPTGPPQTLAGKLLLTDPAGDAGLIGIVGCGVVPVSPIADAAHAPQTGDHVFSIGCGNGEPPTKQQHRVTGVNLYKGPDTVECDGMPVQGRSGGGLFDAAGRVTGICIAAQREDQRGVYAGLAVVHKLLEDGRYGFLVPQPAGTQVAAADPADSFEAAIAAAEGEAAAAPQDASNPFAAATAAPPEPPRFEPAGIPQPIVVRTDALTPGAEVTCIIRDAAGRTETVVINKASRKFVGYLRGELDAVPVETAAVVPAAAVAPGPVAAADAFAGVVPTAAFVPAAPRPIWVPNCRVAASPARFQRTNRLCVTAGR